MNKIWRFVFPVLALATVVGQADRCNAQIVFNGIDPGQTTTYSDDPKALRRNPIETESKADKPYAPAPHFSNSNVLPDRIEMGTISQTDLRPDRIVPDKIPWSVITKEYIAPQRLSERPVLPAMSPGERMTVEATPSRPIWSFDQQDRGRSKPTEQIGSSILLKVPDYDLHQSSPVTTEWQEQEAAFRPTHPTHPMSW
jgi:hypothetical protein